MITLSEVKDGRRTIGIEINVKGHKYFISADQNEWPGLRTGPYPNRQNYSTAKPEVIEYEKEPFYELKELVKKTGNS